MEPAATPVKSSMSARRASMEVTVPLVTALEIPLIALETTVLWELEVALVRWLAQLHTIAPVAYSPSMRFLLMLSIMACPQKWGREDRKIRFAKEHDGKWEIR